MRIGRVAAGSENKMGRGAVKLAGIEMSQPETFGEAARQGALARGRRPVDRDDKGPGTADASSPS